jgi:hypothetical protein
VHGDVVRSFSYSARAPFARGARRGVELAAARGERVVAPCSGPISFRGSVPRFGPALSIRCGAYVATLLRVRATRNAVAHRGFEVGRATGPVHLGARRAGQRWGYVDPLALIAADPAPLGPAPLPRAVSRRLRPRPAVPPRVAASPVHVPWTAWAGIGLLGSLLGPWAISTSRRRSTTSTLRRILAMRTR